MREIEIKMNNAIERRRNWSLSNTKVLVLFGVVYVYLHDNLIMKMSRNGVKYYSIAGWNTPTTRSRLRALGCNVTTRRGKLYRDGVEWSGCDW